MEASIGVDVSRGGDDTIIATRRGIKAYPFIKVDPPSDGPAIGRAVKREAFARKASKVKVDGTGGYGLSVIDYLKADGNLTVLSVIYNKSATRPESFSNIRTEMYVRLRDWVRNGGALPSDPMLKEDLLAPKLQIRGSVFSLEPKEDIRKRLGRSPDRGDALAQTFVDSDELVEGAEQRGEFDDLKFDEKGNRRDINEIYYLIAKRLQSRQNTSHHISGDMEDGRMLNSNHLS